MESSVCLKSEITVVIIIIIIITVTKIIIKSITTLNHLWVKHKANNELSTRLYQLNYGALVVRIFHTKLFLEKDQNEYCHCNIILLKIYDYIYLASCG